MYKEYLNLNDLETIAITDNEEIDLLNGSDNPRYIELENKYLALGKEFEEVYDRNSEYKKKLKDTLLEKGLLLAIKVGIITTLLGSTFIPINSLALMTIGLPLTVAVPAIYAHYEMKRLDKKFDMYNELLEMTQDRIDQIYTEMESIQYEKQAILTSIKRIKSKELALMAYKENKIDDFVIIDDVKRLVRK